MMIQATEADGSARAAKLYLAFELSSSKWKLGFGDGGVKVREVTMDAGDLPRLKKEIEVAKRRFGLEPSCAVRSCYEAGRDGFWLHRYLVAQGLHNVVMNPSSIEVDRRAKHAKTDSLDVKKLLGLLIRSDRGEPKAFRSVRVPSVADEDGRQPHRELERLKSERTRLGNRARGLLVTQGIELESVSAALKDELDAMRLWDSSPLPAALLASLKRLCDLLGLVQAQIDELEQQRRAESLTLKRAAKADKDDSKGLSDIVALMRVRGIGIHSAFVLSREFFSWRDFQNGKEVGACAGLTPTPFCSGNSRREQGISKAGNRRVRALAIELAWGWLRFQPDSALTKWFLEKFDEGKRSRKVGIVAVARRLLVALWRYLKHGVVPEGAVLKA